jgi:DNA-binding LytR/AlgR family response regulator
MKLNCIIVDDEPVARKGIAEYVSEVDFLNLVAQCENPIKAAAVLNEQPVDLIFLDIHMPKISGIEFLKTLKHPPLVIVTTAYPEYALEGYALDVVDYLMKPIPFERFLKASQKAFEIHSLQRLAGRRSAAELDARNWHSDFFFVKCDSKFEKVFYNDVLYIEALQNYAVIHTKDRKLITYITMTSLENQLPAAQFIKVHKSYIISVSHVKAIEGNEILIGEARIPISRNLKDDVVAQILGNNLFKR